MPRNINLIPRRSGDSVNPRVGVRGVIAGKAVYSQKLDRLGTIVIIVLSDPNPLLGESNLACRSIVYRLLYGRSFVNSTLSS